MSGERSEPCKKWVGVKAALGVETGASREYIEKVYRATDNALRLTFFFFEIVFIRLFLPLLSLSFKNSFLLFQPFLKNIRVKGGRDFNINLRWGSFELCGFTGVEDLVVVYGVFFAGF